MSGGLQRGANQKYQDPFEVDRYVDYFLKLRQPLHTKRVLEFLGKGHFMLGMSLVTVVKGGKKSLVNISRLLLFYDISNIYWSYNTQVFNLKCFNRPKLKENFAILNKISIIGYLIYWKWPFLIEYSSKEHTGRTMPPKHNFWLKTHTLLPQSLKWWK